jgi:mono/diheme cytochrome c family protein
MGRAFLNLALFFVFLGTLGLHALTDRNMAERNFEFLPNMVDSVSYLAYAPNPNFANGMTLQLPEPGTIPRGFLPLHYQSSPEDAVRAGTELHNPFASKDQSARERGAFVYSNYCLVCHGPQGKGDGPVLERGVPLPASLLGDRAIQMKDGQIFHVLTYGQGNMPPYAAQLSREDRWKVILHVRHLQTSFAEKKTP